MKVSKKGIYVNRLLFFIIVIGLLLLSIILGITANIEYHYNINSSGHLTYAILSFVLIVVTLIISISKTKYELKRQKLLIEIVNYIKFMTATNNYTLKAIANEFEESIEIVEANIQEAIDKNILKNIYISKQTKEIFITNSLTDNKKIKGNIQNVNVENNIIVNEKEKITNDRK